jgi:hypothetical protein
LGKLHFLLLGFEIAVRTSLGLAFGALVPLEVALSGLSFILVIITHDAL